MRRVIILSHLRIKQQKRRESDHHGKAVLDQRFEELRQRQDCFQFQFYVARYFCIFSIQLWSCRSTNEHITNEINNHVSILQRHPGFVSIYPSSRQTFQLLFLILLTSSGHSLNWTFFDMTNLGFLVFLSTSILSSLPYAIDCTWGEIVESISGRRHGSTSNKNSRVKWKVRKH